MVERITRAHVMVAGDHFNSYANNSAFPRSRYACVKGIIEEAILTNFDVTNKNIIRVADLGCSTGPNTFYTVDSIIDAFSERLAGDQDLEFQVFFNDLVENDFNMLFHSMPDDHRYFAAAAPGSFYSRLFPRDSIHYFHSTLCLHWLSQAPPGVVNKGRIHINGGGPTIVEAYMAQFRADMASFLSARAEELVAGGLMTLLLLCRPECVDMAEMGQQWFIGHLEPILMQLCDEGKVQKEDLDSFHLPTYHPSLEEYKEVVEMDGHYIILAAQVLDGGLKSLAASEVGSTPCSINKNIKNIAVLMSRASRAVHGELLKSHFGEEAVEETYTRLPMVLQKELHGDQWPSVSTAFFILQRKAQ